MYQNDSVWKDKVGFLNFMFLYAIIRKSQHILNDLNTINKGPLNIWRRLFHRCGASVDLELSCLETLLSLAVKGSSEGILYDEIYLFCMCICGPGSPNQWHVELYDIAWEPF